MFSPRKDPFVNQAKNLNSLYVIFLTLNIKHYQILAIFLRVCVCVCVCACVCFLQTSAPYYALDSLLTGSPRLLAGIYVLALPVGWLAP